MWRYFKIEQYKRNLADGLAKLLGTKIATFWVPSTWIKPKRLALIEACIIGVISGLAAVFLKQASGGLGSLRLQASEAWGAWLILPFVGGLGGWLAGWLVQQFAQETSGTGVPQVKAALNGIPIALDGRVALVKLVSTTITLAAGFPLGRQGPTVQVGAALAAWLSRWIPTSPDYRRQLIAAGAAAGLAAGFNAPIAGVLFVVEELLQDLSSLTLGPAILASFVGAVVSRLLGGDEIDLNLEMATQTTTSFSAVEIPFYLLLGLLAGILGSFFQKGVLGGLTFTNKVLHWSLPKAMAIAGLACGAMVSILPSLFWNNTGLREMIVTGEASVSTAAIAFFTHFMLTILVASSGAPGGLFAPSLVVGAALGYMVGVFQMAWLGVASPVTYALAGMGSFFCAVSKTPITAVVIVFEITTDFNLVLPLMIGSVVAYLAAERMTTESLYDRILELKGYRRRSRRLATNNLLTQLQARDVMQRHVEILPSDMTLDRVAEIFSRSNHRGLPVVENGQLVGILTQGDLAERYTMPHLKVGEIMTPHPLTVTPTDTLQEVLYLLTRYRVSRLPVTEGRRLVGIITRSDIIRAESEYVSQELSQKNQRQPSYKVYQTRAPATGRGRILVPLANPDTAGGLLRMAAAIAREREYELECLHVIRVPSHDTPAETPVNIAPSRSLLDRAVRIGETWEIPVHTQIRVANRISHAILETIQERHIDLLLMGWKGNTVTPGRLFGNAVDTLLQQAPCDVVLVSGLFATPDAPAKVNPGENQNDTVMPLLFNRWLVPVRGGSNSKAALELLPALLTFSKQPYIRLCQIFDPSTGSGWHPAEGKHRPIAAQEAAAYLKSLKTFRDKSLQSTVFTAGVPGVSVSDTVIKIANKNDYDVVLLGASREGIFQQAIKGNIPEAIASGCQCTVIIVRKCD